MRSAGLLIALLVAATVLVDLVVLSIVVSGTPAAWPHPATVFFFSLAFSQANLLAVWAGLGGRMVVLRYVVWILGVALWSKLVALTVNPTTEAFSTTIWAVILLAQGITIIGLLMIARQSGIGLAVQQALPEPPSATGVSPVPLDTHGQDARATQPLQFSLWQMFGWMTALAVALGLLRYVVHYEVLPLAYSFWMETLILCVGNVLVALAALWAGLGTRRPGVRILVLCLAIVAATAAAAVWEPGVADPRRVYSMLFCFQALWLVGSLLVIRIAGYRLAQTKRFSQQSRGTPSEPGPTGGQS